MSKNVRLAIAVAISTHRSLRQPGSWQGPDGCGSAGAAIGPAPGFGAFGGHFSTVL